MPFRYNWEKNGFYSKFWGEVLNWEIEVKNMYFSNDPRCDKCHYQIIDASEVEAFALSEIDITKMASNDIGMGFYLKNFSVAIVCATPEVQAAFQKYISICLPSKMTWTYHICDTLEEANAWLEQQSEKRRKTKLQSKQDQAAPQSHPAQTAKSVD